ncbi:MAG TPA: branched-chain amino acid ABC transporter permease [Acidimicrobiales bacterium]|nr:branched-chain amino acid ABC transporter permease [Acidimicrobiales bacterium]
MQDILNGISQGSIYALAAVGLSVIFGVARVPHFAHGESVMLGGMVALVATDHDVPLVPALLLGCVAATCLGVAFSALVFHPLRRYSEVSLLIVSLALVLILESIAFKIWGDTPRVIPGAPSHTFDVLGARITSMKLLIVVVTFWVVVATHLYISRSRAGRALKAMALNAYAAQLMGIPLRRFSMIAFGLGSLLAGLGGGLLGTVLPIQTQMGSALALKSFIIIIFAGMGSVLGAWAGGLMLGLVESFGASYVSSGYIDTFAFVFLVGVLLLRPEGLFALGGTRD